MRKHKKGAVAFLLMVAATVFSAFHGIAYAGGLSGIEFQSGEEPETGSEEGRLPDPCHVYGEYGLLNQTEYEFEEGYVCDVYEYPLPDDTKLFIREYQKQAELAGFSVSECTIDQYKAYEMSLSDKCAYFIMITDENVMLLLVEQGMDFSCKMQCAQCGGIGDCEKCGGNKLCTMCNGKGECLDNYSFFGKVTYTCRLCGGKKKCLTCGGTGECRRCDGSGSVTEQTGADREASGSTMIGKSDGFSDTSHGNAHKSVCWMCDGNKVVKCEVCGGTGENSSYKYLTGALKAMSKPYCEACDGEKYITCGACHGEGVNCPFDSSGFSD